MIEFVQLGVISMNSAEIIDIIQTLHKEKKLPFSWEKDAFKPLRENGQNLPLIAGDKILRIPKSGKTSKTWDDLERESQITTALQKQNLQTKISDVKLFEAENICFAYHDIIPGDILEGKKGEALLDSLSDTQKNFLAHDLAVFFSEIHNIPLSEVKHIRPYDGRRISYDYEKMPDFDYATNKKLLNRFGIDLDNFRTPISQDKVFCHNDLHGGNLAVDASKEHILNGVFDFGNADINDRSADFVKLCAMNRRLARQTVSEYNKISNKTVNMKEVDYQYLNWMAQSIGALEKMELTPEQKQAVFNKVQRDFNLFKADVIKEKTEVCSAHTLPKNPPVKLSQSAVLEKAKQMSKSL